MISKFTFEGKDYYVDNTSSLIPATKRIPKVVGHFVFNIKDEDEDLDAPIGIVENMNVRPINVIFFSSKFTFEGKDYMRDANNVVYDYKSHLDIGTWRDNTIDFDMPRRNWDVNLQLEKKETIDGKEFALFVTIITFKGKDYYKTLEAYPDKDDIKDDILKFDLYNYNEEDEDDEDENLGEAIGYIEYKNGQFHVIEFYE